MPSKPLRMIALTPDQSSQVAEFGYLFSPGQDYGELYVRFRSGGLYCYQSVPKAYIADLISAPSIGGFLNAVIKPISPCCLLNEDFSVDKIVKGPVAS